MKWYHNGIFNVAESHGKKASHDMNKLQPSSKQKGNMHIMHHNPSVFPIILTYRFFYNLCSLIVKQYQMFSNARVFHTNVDTHFKIVDHFFFILPWILHCAQYFIRRNGKMYANSDTMHWSEWFHSGWVKFTHYVTSETCSSSCSAFELKCTNGNEQKMSIVVQNRRISFGINQFYTFLLS